MVTALKRYVHARSTMETKKNIIENVQRRFSFSILLQKSAVLHQFAARAVLTGHGSYIIVAILFC